MGDQDKDKNVEKPDVVQKVCDELWLHQTERTVHVIAPRLCSVVMVGSKVQVPRLWPIITKLIIIWARVIKSHELPKVVSYQGVQVTKRQAMSDSYGSDYDLLSQDKYMVCLSQGMSRKEPRIVLVKPRSREGSVSERLCNVRLYDARDELVIVYETIKKLCIRSHVSKCLGIFSFLFLNTLPSVALSTCIGSGVVSEGLVVGSGGFAKGLGGGLSALIRLLSIDVDSADDVDQFLEYSVDRSSSICRVDDVD
ncbi:hypothetical protein F2Q69_00012936 [Brassica cretica]|uniref:Uncharacterized protein n=1 Tax=Brassica cretica TaxID=69181 RepID=A0A8S9R764_BRACR|nr:hypothetical protein F2Q69_00012936 [Brassica cretica]